MSLQRVRTISNFDFFRAVEYVVREAMKEFETGQLPVAEAAVRDAGFNVGSYPVEGYYSETSELTRYFLCVKTLQNKYSESATPAIRTLQEIYSHRVFGLMRGRRTALNPSPANVYLPALEPVTISPVVDPVTVASYRTMPHWTVDGIMDAVDREKLGDGLVGLACMVDDEYLKMSVAKSDRDAHHSRYNPVATCMACETTVLSRTSVVAAAPSPPTPKVDWRVSREVEAAGNRVVQGYRELISTHSSVRAGPSWAMKELAEGVTPDSIVGISYEEKSPIRCVCLNTDEMTGRKDKYYHWAIGNARTSSEDREEQRDRDYYDCFRVREIWSPNITTTEAWRKEELERRISRDRVWDRGRG